MLMRKDLHEGIRTCFDEDFLQGKLSNDIEIRLCFHRASVQSDEIAQLNELKGFIQCPVERMYLIEEKKAFALFQNRSDTHDATGSDLLAMLGENRIEIVRCSAIVQKQRFVQTSELL
jgi:hypothetical protein